MTLTLALLAALHALAAVVWVGGMFFAYMVLRPATGPLAAPMRLQLWQRVLGRFFPWVWASVAVHLATGYGMLFAFFGGFHAGIETCFARATVSCPAGVFLLMVEPAPM